MAQAAVDLPDPLNQTAGSAANTDDLLSQLAGNEIDRLLAEADSDHGPAVSAPKLFKPIKDSAVIPQPQELNVDKNSGNLANELDDLLSQGDDKNNRGKSQDDEEKHKRARAAPPAETETGPTERAAVFEAAGFDTAVPTTAAPAEQSADSSDVVEPGTEREALLTAAGFDPSAPTDAEQEDFEDPIPEYVAPLPVYLKPLQFLSAPLESLSPTVRDLLGKLGIVTLINAVAGIAYVYLFKKH